MERLAEFKEFVREHPGLKSAVRSGQTTWQLVYEEWYLFGPEDKQWEIYKDENYRPLESGTDGSWDFGTGADNFGSSGPAQASENTSHNPGNSNFNGGHNHQHSSNSTGSGRIEFSRATEIMGQAYEFLQKVDIDKLQASMGTFQQFIQLFQSFQTGRGNNQQTPPPGAGTGTAGGRPRFSGYFSQFDD